MSILHAFHSGKTNSSDPTLASSDAWNAAHSQTFTSKTKTIDYTLDVDGNGAITDDVIRCSGTMALTIPAATGSDRKVLVVFDAGTVAVTITRSGSDKIGITDGGFVVTQAGDSIELVDEAVGYWAMRYVAAHELREGYESTATAAGTTTLTELSKYTQLFTGSTTQTVKMPDVTKIPIGSTYQIINLSTAAVAVQSSGANAITTLNPNDYLWISSVLATGTTAASWSAQVTPKITKVSLAADFTTNTSTSLSSITGLGFAIGNNETWCFECHMGYANSAATGSSFGIKVSAGSATVNAQATGNTTSQTAGRWDRIVAMNTETAGTTYGGANVTTNQMHITGIVTAGASDACTVYPAIRPRGALTNTVYAGSFIVAHRISP